MTLEHNKKNYKIFGILMPKMDERVEQLFYIFPLKIVFFSKQLGCNK